MNITTLRDPHLMVHFVGCYAIVLTLTTWGIPIFLSVILGIMAGLIWDCIGDEYLCKKKNKCFGMFDHTGGSWTDIAADVLGCLLALGVLLI